MEKKNSLFIRYMKFWYGINGPLDEHKRAEMEHVGNVAFFIMFLILIPVFLVSGIVYSRFSVEMAYWTLWIGIIFSFLAALVYVGIASKKAQLTEYEVEAADLAKAKKAAWIKGVICGIIWGLVMLIFNLPLSDHDFFVELLIWVIGGIVFGVAMALFTISKIKVIKDDDE